MFGPEDWFGWVWNFLHLYIYIHTHTHTHTNNFHGYIIITFE